MKLVLDEQQGIIPQDMSVAKKVNLITLPTDIDGKNCGTCRFKKVIQGDVLYCLNNQVKQYVSARNACKLWDNPDIIRY